MIYTSYYGNHRQYKGMFRVSISRTAPPNSHDIQLKKLAPELRLLQAFKNGSITNDEYIITYTDQLLRLDNTGYIEQVVGALHTVTDDVVLLCYEKKGDFCHRHILSEWLNRHYSTGIREL